MAFIDLNQLLESNQKTCVIRYRHMTHGIMAEETNTAAGVAFANDRYKGSSTTWLLSTTG